VLARVDAAGLEAWPDALVGAEVERFRGGEYTVMPRVRVSLPFLRPGRTAAMKEEARALLGEAWHRYEAAGVEIARQVAAAHARVRGARASIALYADRLRPQARQTFEAAMAGYRSGEVDFLTTVDALLEFQAVEEQHHRLLGDGLAAREALRRAAGDVP
jgi:outer membrane protein, heavy metal efflux system